MNTSHQDGYDSSRALSVLSEGWHALKQRAAHALTHFMPAGEAGPGRGASRWSLLPAEVCETEDRVVVALEAPGMRPEDFDVDVIENVLVIRGEKRAAQEEMPEAGRYFLLERAYGAFGRAVHLPADVDRDHATTHYRAGVLAITLPKRVRNRVGRVVTALDKRWANCGEWQGRRVSGWTIGAWKWFRQHRGWPNSIHVFLVQ
ncbi:Hsp20/alpha crystallin family protein [Methylomagnum sp.]